MHRRRFLQGSAGLLTALTVGCSATNPYGRQSAVADPLGYVNPMSVSVPPLTAIDARVDRIIATNVCTRPFRALGPRLELEKLGSKSVVHNYGHGGSGWSLSWGSAELAQQMAAATGEKQIAVVGCGAIGLTAAIAAQRAGMDVKIYAKERPPYVRSSFATGIWSPDSRIVTQANAAPFAETWERMARTSFRRFQSLLGLPGLPVEWTQIYNLSDDPFDAVGHHGADGEPEYPHFSKELIADLTPQAVDIPSKQNPFPVPFVRRSPLLMFNISAYSRLLIETFTQNGGEIITAELQSADDFAKFDEKTIINCTGYGAKDLLNDDTITPVRGQTCKLIPQPELGYGIRYWDKKVSAYPRRDGILVQSAGEGDFGNPVASLDPSESENAVKRLAEVMAAMKSV
ncbi:FAD-dependent oxidoreductase [Halioxenophilus sp. WMMB6]|uniref:FAD-dependent oxidoreductase n=1 Tax=Halioxenophilus sp. WMMB6 TaxID=3073815 RepID=UPI00295F5020|nr:FAD-dependent oxidoreductase [Halioxenophilus sp. WMMB6]